MSIRSDYRNAIGNIRSAAFGGIAGGIILVALAYFEAPPNRWMLACTDADLRRDTEG